MRLITSESVSAGHPDKVADQIADAILDHCISNDPKSRVACEVLCAAGSVTIAGEVTTEAPFDRQLIDSITRDTIRSIGYDFGSFDYKDVEVFSHFHRQSPDIAAGVDARDGHEQGAGDQGIMFGYAEGGPETEYMPPSIFYAHRLMAELAARRECPVDKVFGGWLLPDAKCQLTFDGDLLDAIVVSHQHTEDAGQDGIRRAVLECVRKAIPAKHFRSEILFARPEDEYIYPEDSTLLYVNPTGRFVIGGPEGDTGLTGRKLAVDTYGGVGRLGGGSLSGKDTSKVDRSAAYMCRKAAKDLVREGLCKRCEVAVAYAIGKAAPLQVSVDAFGTGDNEKLSRLVARRYDFRPAAMEEFLGLRRPSGWSYRQTAMNGHFGHPEFPWER